MIIACTGLFLTAYGVWFQTESFKWVPVYHCLLNAAAAFTAAWFLMNYLEEQSVSGKPGTMTVKKGTKSVVNGSIVSFLCGLLVLYRCISLLSFHIGLFVMLFSWACIICHLVLSKKYREEEKKIS